GVPAGCKLATLHPDGTQQDLSSSLAVEMTPQSSYRVIQADQYPDQDPNVYFGTDWLARFIFLDFPITRDFSYRLRVATPPRQPCLTSDGALMSTLSNPLSPASHSTSKLQPARQTGYR
ncbi:hypothetical protein RRG08_020159, partial [Elysia crispata]